LEQSYYKKPENIHDEGLKQNISEDEAHAPPSVAILSSTSTSTLIDSNDYVQESIEPLFESIQEDLISSIAEESLAEEDMVSIDRVRKQPLRVSYSLLAEFI